MSRALTVITHALGLVAFAAPFITGAAARGENAAHAADAPFLFAAFAVLLIVVAAGEIRSGRMAAKEVALLGVLSGMNALLRLPGGLAGASLMFALPILAGSAFGARFAFLLGAASFGVSGIITGGIGPWLPFQMWALGWVGAGGAVVRPIASRWPRARIPALATYGWVAGLAFGGLTNLWFWPFMRGSAAISWEPGIGFGAAVIRYLRFYALTSFAWDTTRAIGNAVLVVALGRVVLRVFDPVAERVHVTWEHEQDAGRAGVPVRG